MPTLVLASQSPRRKELLEQLQIPFIQQPADIEEVISPALHPTEVVQELALQKAQAVANKQSGDAIVLGSDTVVVLENEILQKPADEKEAYRMLRQLSGNTHTVYSGVAIVSARRPPVQFVQATEVTFYELTDAEISTYVRSGEPFDKAGGYGIQGAGLYFVQEICGDFYAVMGLPIAQTARALEKLGIPSVLTKT
ncbi:Maf family protein [Bacillus fonticola]|uniref:Maf family protein n=1 Tax=Bacillus fonticola TaxID=2728853 RepID=UPI00147336AC|nr:Maf family protein [Bacillus fonticola]